MARASLERLLYVSSVSPDAGSRLASALEDILIASTRHNGRRGVSGLLLCDGQTFAQLLEGPDEVVEACFQRIRRDPRHHDLKVRRREAVAERVFPRWSMCGLYLSNLDDALLTPGDIDFDIGEASDGALLQHLRGLGHRYGDVLNAQHARLLA
ncbi:BLUF domain-containing protein [uncultured Caulobacter sp.]|uniref:BLUF domain-containing protein n=1 Tax=uncultured Caulobacter sp. TaxID=158749 RepID=UPI00261968D2|nr:BLUF domain-containing protein [uncultured Caulobacter sp.]